jgi:uncharacterized membrane protein
VSLLRRADTAPKAEILAPRDPSSAARSALGFGLATALLGLVGIVFRDFALVWQPVPKTVPARELLACACGAVTLLGGVMLLAPTYARRAALFLAGLYGLWSVGLHGPRLLGRLNEVSRWLSLAEILALAAAAALLWARLSPPSPRTAGILSVSRAVFGCCALVFGLSHLAYPEVTASLIPPWMPARVALAYFTGFAHIAAGLAILSGLLARIAATLQTLMFLTFAVFVQGPALIADPLGHRPWTMLAVTLTLTGAAWVVRSYLQDGAREPDAQRRPHLAVAA